MTQSDKRSSLLHYRIYYGRKKFISQAIHERKKYGIVSLSWSTLGCHDIMQNDTQQNRVSFFDHSSEAKNSIIVLRPALTKLPILSDEMKIITT